MREKLLEKEGKAMRRSKRKGTKPPRIMGKWSLVKELKITQQSILFSVLLFAHFICYAVVIFQKFIP